MSCPAAISLYKKRAGSSGPGVIPYGPDRTPGLLLQPSPTAVLPNLPAKTGMGMQLKPAKLGPNSCVPLAEPEPMGCRDPQLEGALQSHDSLREVQPHTVLNKLVYDCLLPAEHFAQRAALTSGKSESGATFAAAVAAAGAAAIDGVTAVIKDVLCPATSLEPESAPASIAGIDPASMKRAASRASSSSGSNSDAEAEPAADLASNADTISTADRSSRPADLGGFSAGSQIAADRSSGASARAQPSIKFDDVGIGAEMDRIAQDAAGDRASSGADASTSYAKQFDYFEDLPAWYSVAGSNDKVGHDQFGATNTCLHA